MNKISGIIAEPSVRQVEFLNYVPAIMVYETEIKDLDISSLEKAVSFFITRHESVRTVFPVIDGEVKQLILPADDERFSIAFIDAAVSGDAARLEMRRKYVKQTEEQFTEKQEGPLIRFFLFRSGPDKHTFLLMIDHIICDAWSMQKVIREEIMMFYNAYLAGSEPDIKPLKIQLRDYCNQQKKWLQQSKTLLSNFWKTKLAGYGDRFDINSYYAGYYLRKGLQATPKAKERVKTEKQFFKLYDDPESHLYTFKVSGETFVNIKRMAELHKCTMSAVAYAALYIFLYGYTGRKKLLMAAFIADRFAPSYRPLIGLLVGTVYFPGEIPEQMTVRDFVGKTLYEILDNCQNIIFSHEYLGIEEKKLNLSYDLLVNYIKIDAETPDIQELRQPHIAILGSPHIWETMIHEYDDSFVFYWKYKPLFDKDIIEDMAECCSAVLDVIAGNSGKTIGEIKKCLTPEVA